MKVNADGQEVEIGERKLTVLLHQQDMAIELQGSHLLISPETTVELAKTLEQDQWALIRQHATFLKAWDTIWGNDKGGHVTKPPEVLARGTLASRHIAGMILLLHRARSENLQAHIQYPETYLHPAQCAAFMSMYYTIYPDHQQ